ncbi:MAG: ThuA domain-containing protein [Candidatus Hydrogenedentes bacterium]|nr:ThuA domain-containing protein [Candidatus Hydrogenedentota bacterium]
MSQGLRVTIWNEGVHEKTNPKVSALYPDGLGRQIARYIEQVPGIASVRVAELDDPEHGLTDEVLENTDVMTWWGHTAHDRVDDAIVEKVRLRVVEHGMGLVVLHSGHFSKIFKRLMGTSCDLKWREYNNEGEKERLWVVDPAHPIAHGLPEMFELEKAEMYGEHFDIPQPDQLVLISWFQGGEVFRSGCCWHRGLGKVFYFRPGHETLPIYHNETVLKVIANGIQWAAPTRVAGGIKRGNAQPLEKME